MDKANKINIKMLLAGAIMALPLAMSAAGSACQWMQALPALSSAEQVQDDRENPVDFVSAVCISCHDGMVSANVHFKVWDRNDRGATMNGSHPIGQNYEEIQLHNYRMFAPVDKVQATLKLVNGRVSCVTCHDVFNPNNTDNLKLAVDNRGSKLCFTCHLK